MKRTCLIHWLFAFLLTLTAPTVLAQQPGGVPIYKFTITEYPVNTPHDATLYLTGNFTKWTPGNPAYRFVKQPDGTYQTTVQSTLNRIEYKVTRGNWTSVEGREGGKVRPNRVLFRNATPKGPREVEIRVESWEDLSGTFHFYSLYDLLMLFSAFQGLLLIIAIPGIQNHNRPANRWLVLLLGLTSALVLIRCLGTNRTLAQAYTTLLLLPDFIWFLYAPIFYIYLRKLLFNTNRPASAWWRHFVPALVQIGVYMPYLLTDNKLLQLKLVNHDPWLQGLFLVVGLLALGYNAAYWLLCRRAIRTYQDQHQMVQSTEPQVHYLNAVLAIQAVCLGLWAFFFALVSVGSLANLDILEIGSKNVDLIWLTFSSIIFLLGYYAIHQPELFKLPDTQHLPLLDEAPAAPVRADSFLPNVPTEPVALFTAPGLPGQVSTGPSELLNAAQPPADRPEPTETLLELKLQVDAFMRRHKPYTNPNLTLSELALRLKMPPHVLSKVLNEGYQKNFFDFINQLRIDELKGRLNDPRFRSYTLLSMAFEVGFNSKTAFNRSFKKLTNQTPSEYIQTRSNGVPIGK